MKNFYLPIFLVSLSAICYETLLVRLLEIIQFSEVSSVVISLSLLGFGYSGLFCFFYLKKTVDQKKISSLIHSQTILFSLAILLCFPIAQQVPFNALNIFWEKKEGIFLLMMFFLCSIPFFFASNFILLVMSQSKKNIHKVYFYDLIGAGCGAFVAYFLLNFINSYWLLLAVSTPTLLNYLIVNHIYQKKINGYFLILFTGLSFYHLSYFKLSMNPYKTLSKILFIPGTKVLYTKSSSDSHLSLVQSKKIPFRQAPGLSILYPHKLPHQLSVFADGSSFYPIDQDKPSLLKENPTHYYQYIPESFSYKFNQQDNLKILQLGLAGANPVRVSNYWGNKDITVLEPNDDLIEIFEHPLLLNQKYTVLSKANIVHNTVRSFILNNKNKFDRIVLSKTHFSSDQTSSAATSSHDEWFTIEAFREYKRNLSKKGALIISLWKSNPPKDLFKLWLTLKESGFLAHNIINITSLNTHFILAFSQKFNQSLWHLMKKHADELSYKIIHKKSYKDLFKAYLPNNKINFEQTNNIDNYPFMISPSTDDRPFFSHSSKVSTFLELLVSGRRKSSDVLLLNPMYFYLWLALLVAILASLFLIFLPLLFIKKKNIKSPYPQKLFLFYFILLGISFMLIEFTAIQKLKLFLGHKMWSFSFVLGTFLIFAGLGSLQSTMITKASYKRKRICIPFLGILLCSAFFLGITHYFSDYILMLSYSSRLITLAALIIPLSYFMGMPFVLGLKMIPKTDKVDITWAWSINACASVISAIGAKLLNLHFGFSMTMLIAVICYLQAFIFLSTLTKRTSS